MTYSTVDFDAGEQYVLNRPKGAVVLHGPGGPHGTQWKTLALVDTGADYLHLPEEAAQKVGIFLYQAPVFRISTAGGVIRMVRRNVDVEIQGVKVNVPVNFARGAVPLIGRQAIFRVLEAAGFTTREWLLKWRTSTPQFQQVKKLESLSNAGIVDHGSWVDIGGVRIDKR